MKTVLYPGSFDPFTNGHRDLVARAGLLFDQVIVAVAVNSEKSPMFTLEERKELIEKSCADLPHVKVVAFRGLVVDAIEKYNAQAVLRGLRAFSDFEYELQMAQTNRVLAPDVDTVFLTTSLEYAYLSSTIMKEVANFGGDLSKFAPSEITEAVEEKLKKRETEK